MLNKMMRTIGVSALVTGALLGSGAVYAATVTATASITDVTAMGLTLSNNSFLSDASTPFQSGFDTGSVLQNYNFSTTSPSGTSLAMIDNSYTPLPQTTAAAITNGSGAATVLWTFDWVADVTGTAMLDVEYLYAATVANLGLGESATASSYVSALLDGTAIGDEAFFYFNNEEGDTSGFNTLGLSFGVSTGQTGTFTLAVASNAVALAAVPVPAAIWLLGSALAGLTGFARRKV